MGERERGRERSHVCGGEGRWKEDGGWDYMWLWLCLCVSIGVDLGEFRGRGGGGGLNITTEEKKIEEVGW